MILNDLECQNRGFYGFFSDFGLTQRLFLHYLGKTQLAKYHFFIQRILFTFLTLWLTFHPAVHFPQIRINRIY